MRLHTLRISLNNIWRKTQRSKGFHHLNLNLPCLMSKYHLIEKKRSRRIIIHPSNQINSNLSHLNNTNNNSKFSNLRSSSRMSNNSNNNNSNSSHHIKFNNKKVIPLRKSIKMLRKGKGSSSKRINSSLNTFINLAIICILDRNLKLLDQI